jgi:hypothetical protein
MSDMEESLFNADFVLVEKVGLYILKYKINRIRYALAMNLQNQKKNPWISAHF